VAKKSLIARENKRVRTIKRFKDKRRILKDRIKKVSVSLTDRLEAQQQLQRLPRNASPIRHERRCGLCGRPRGVYRKFILCRICLRERLMCGEIPGGRKASW